MKQLNDLYREWSGAEPFDIETLAGAGSNRRYVRFTDRQGCSVIGVVGTSQEENDAFLYLSRHFAEKGLPVPDILSVSADRMCYLQSDLGCRSLFGAIEQGRTHSGNYSEGEIALLERTIRLLPHVQVEGAEGLDWNHCYPKPYFDRESVMFDFNYFKYCFLKPFDVDFNESRLEADFQCFADELLTYPAETFMYRDFQSRNVMLDASGCPHLIDYQGGRRGPYYYDVASFLWQASARFSSDLRSHLVAVYYEELSRLISIPDIDTFNHHLRSFVAFRTLQVLGAYGFRGFFERKQHFIDSIPPALDNLRGMIADGVFAPYPHLEETLQRLVKAFVEQQPAESKPLPASELQSFAPDACQRLMVTVWSFSYKRGLPVDESGNGGGYVFDCRSTHNPGRYEQYKQLTGLDQPVIDFLETDGEILTFLSHIYPLAEHHVERFLQRGFTHLMFAFGCTGGQHRSVYCAQHLAEYLHRKYGVTVQVHHREQDIHTLL